MRIAGGAPKTELLFDVCSDQPGCRAHLRTHRWGVRRFLRMLFEHVFDHHEFDPGALAEAKVRAGTTVSVCLPARDEAQTVGTIVETISADLVGGGLVDEIVVMDDGSRDGTGAAAADAGASVVDTSEVLSGLGPGRGKGDALWKSLYVAEGDLICWLDADLVEFSSHFVTGLLGPLISRPSISFVKGFYQRVGEGGRVTEIMARPAIARLLPHLASVIQPLGGEYAGRRSTLEQVPFLTGWGVEIGLLADVVDRFGAGAVAQVDLGFRRHRSRSLHDLGVQAAAVLDAALRRAGVDQDAGGGELVRALDRDRIERTQIETRERPPMVTMPEYRRRHGAGEQTA